MFVELHILQNFAPSNLNRDDTGSPKSCEFGGYRRARISSQCIKRAVRMTFKSDSLVPEQFRAKRTKRLVEEVSDRLLAAGKEREQASKVVEAALAGLEIAVGSDGKTQYLLYLGEREIASIVTLCTDHWDGLLAAVAAEPEGRAQARNIKKAGREAIPDSVRKAALAALDGGKASDLALFGRMLADVPERNIDAASQVAHAISTNQVSMEFDFYTAVDDMKPQDTTGADMLGTVEFNSACFYRYANIDLRQLRKNLGNDAELAEATTEAFLRASIAAVPTGKQNSFAAQNQPAFVFTVIRDAGLWSLANAFLKPVRPSNGHDLVHRSIEALDGHWAALSGMYGTGQIAEQCVATLAPDALSSLTDSDVGSVDALIEKTLAAARGGLGES